MIAWLAIVLQTGSPALDAQRFDLHPATRPIDLTVGRPCAGVVATGEIVVCGRRRDRDRLPLPIERPPDERVRGDVPSGVAALTPAAPCGIFAGERRCGKREAAAYGYGGGRDPVTLATRLIGHVADPDAD